MKQKNFKHGLKKHPLYRAWGNMKSRCNNPDNIGYENYGGRGITVCKEWSDNFMTFYEWAIRNGWEKKLSIDRINNNGDYSPKNCRFVTSKMQADNRRDTIFILYKGQNYTALDLCKKLKLPKSMHSSIATKMRMDPNKIEFIINRYKCVMNLEDKY